MYSFRDPGHVPGLTHQAAADRGSRPGDDHTGRGAHVSLRGPAIDAGPGRGTELDAGGPVAGYCPVGTRADYVPSGPFAAAIGTAPWYFRGPDTTANALTLPVGPYRGPTRPAGNAHLAWNGTSSIFYAFQSRGKWHTRYWGTAAGSIGEPSMTIGADQVPRIVFQDGDDLLFATLRDPDVRRLRTETIASVASDSCKASRRQPARLVRDEDPYIPAPELQPIPCMADRSRRNAREVDRRRHCGRDPAPVVDHM